MSLLVRICGAVAALSCVLALGAGSAAAATRYAAPGGSGADPCAEPAAPCSLFDAASADAPGTTVSAADTVVVAAGTYSGDADLGAEETIVTPAALVGAPGPAPKLLGGAEGEPLLALGESSSASHLLLEATSPAALRVTGGTADGLVVRDSHAGGFACEASSGIVRDSACLASGANGRGLGASLEAGAAGQLILRNVTAVATGSGSFGLGFWTSGVESLLEVDAQATIAQGASADVFGSSSGAEALTLVRLEHSDYAHVLAAPGALGEVTITPEGALENLTAPPLLAADGYHELPGSPTVDKGFVAAGSGSADIDGQDRTIGSRPDIGADELAHQTTTEVACDPAALVVHDGVVGSAECTVTVSDTSPTVGSPPAGEMAIAPVVGAEVPASCVLEPVGPKEASCTVSLAPEAGREGDFPLAATYPGDARHDTSSGQATVSVAAEPKPPAAAEAAAPAPSAPGLATPDGSRVPGTTLAKHPGKRGSARLAKFTFGADVDGAHFECRLDKAPWKPCRSPFSRAVDPGAHVLRVRALNDAGTDPSPVVFRWTRVLSPAR